MSNRSKLEQSLDEANEEARRAEAEGRVGAARKWRRKAERARRALWQQRQGLR